MYCDKIAISVDHWVRGKSRKDSFFVIDCTWQEAVQVIGDLYMNEHDVRAYMDWALNNRDEEGLLLLVSLDMKYGLVKHADEFYAVPVEYDFYYFLPQSEATFGGFDFLKYTFDQSIERNPELAEKVGYVIPPRPIKRRVKFEHMLRPIFPGDLVNEIQNGTRNLESATDDALVWMVIIGPKWRGWNSVDYQRVLNEVELRQKKHESFMPRFFPLDKISMDEMLARQARVRVTYQKFMDAFPGIGLDFHDHVLTEKWAQKLGNDRLAELAVCLFFAGDMEDLWKLVVGVLQRRYPNNEDE